MTTYRVPRATYRLQFNQNFTFNDARKLVPYLQALGISDIYASPLFRARSGSPHGYDVTDPTRLNPELGTEQDFDDLAQELTNCGMGLLLDIVPNHMAASVENPWWWSVLKFGKASPSAEHFDLFWNSPVGDSPEQIVLPILGQSYHRALQTGELQLHLDDDGLSISYYDLRLPLRDSSYRKIFELTKELEPEQLVQPPDLLEGLEDSFQIGEGMEFQSAGDDERRFGDLMGSSPEFRVRCQQVIDHINQSAGGFNGSDLLHKLLAEQHYRLIHWRNGNEQLNYRRFFDISDLVGIRVEDPAVFETTHSLVARLVKEGKITGLRIDHIDGLLDPKTYLDRLQRSATVSGQPQDVGIYTIVEKILASGESLPKDWPVEGTTGYDFLNALNRVFVDPEGFEKLTRVYKGFVGTDIDFDDLVYQQKKRALRELFGAELARLHKAMVALARQDPVGWDLPSGDLRNALEEISARLPVYRTYVNSTEISRRDKALLQDVIQRICREADPEKRDAIELLGRILSREGASHLSLQERQARLSFTMQWQQFTGPLMAKGLEDSSLYIYNPLLSVNEVGGGPAGAGSWVEEFHQHNSSALARHPYTLNATATHDTKRGEDSRARINVLSEIPEEWESRLHQWSHWNLPWKQEIGCRLWPDANAEVLIYQTLLGSCPNSAVELPDFKKRLENYLIKAAREAKTYSSWHSPTAWYESALTSFAQAILKDWEENSFLPDFLSFQGRVSFHGFLNSISQTLLKITSPGVPDFYQGTELFDLSMVDPDNRRPVDFEYRQRVFSELKNGALKGQRSCTSNLLGSCMTGEFKLYLTWLALGARQENPKLFREGDYLPLPVIGSKKNHVCAFCRRLSNAWALVVVPRLTTGLVTAGTIPTGLEVWGDTALVLPEGAPKKWKNVLSQEEIGDFTSTSEVPLAQLLSSIPVGLLVG